MRGYSKVVGHVISVGAGLCLTLVLLLLLWSPFSTPTAHAQSMQVLHALPVHYVPVPNAVLQAPPTQVQITFSEQVNPDISKIVVVNPSNQEVDNRDSQVSADGFTMTVSLQLLPAGTYVVFWRTHSADDGHIAAGSYIFHIANANGRVPPLTGSLPSGNIIGGAGTVNNLDFPTLMGALARWVALLGLTLILGMIFWLLFVQPRQELTEKFRAEQNHHLRRMAQIALWVMLAATILEIAAQAILLDGTIAGVVSLPLVRSILVSSRFGEAIFIRIVLIVLGLLALWWSKGSAVLARWNPDLVIGIFGVALALAFEYSGHGGSATTWWGPLIDFTHLLANGIWLGGLMVLALVIVPALWQLSSAERRAYLASSMPAFTVPALVAVAFITITGPLNATTRMTSLQQVWTTAYGIVLIIKSVLFLLMVAISYHHAFRLRPLLNAPAGSANVSSGGRWWNVPLVSNVAARFQAFSLQSSPSPNPGPKLSAKAEGTLALTGMLTSTSANWPNSGQPASSSGSSGSSGSSSAHERIVKAITGWMRVEAGIGAAVLLCAALLGPLAGTLQLIPATTSFGGGGGVQTQTQQVDGLTVTLTAEPGHFGTNTFTVVVKNPNGTAASNGSVFITTSMVEMDMGQNTVNLTPVSAPGTYTGQGEIAMAGHWRLRVVIRTREDPNHLHATTFTLSFSFPR